MYTTTYFLLLLSIIIIIIIIIIQSSLASDLVVLAQSSTNLNSHSADPPPEAVPEVPLGPDPSRRFSLSRWLILPQTHARDLFGAPSAPPLIYYSPLGSSIRKTILCMA